MQQASLSIKSIPNHHIMCYFSPVDSWQIEDGSGVIAQSKISSCKTNKQTSQKITGIETLRSIKMLG